MSVWAAIQRTSPDEGIPEPSDPTNAYANDPAAQKLGRYLFFEPELSGNDSVACADCHIPSKGFTARSPLGVQGAGGTENPTKRHAPTLLNVAYNQWYFWDGRRDTLWSQAIVPFENPIEMASSRLELAHYVYDHPRVRRAYEKVFGSLPARSSLAPFPDEGRPVENPQTPEERQHDQAWDSMTREDQRRVNRIMVNVMKSIAAYEMQLVSLDAPFDRFVDQLRRHPGSPDKWTAISDSARRGMKLFFGTADCSECHDGPHLGNGEFHDLGLPGRPWIDSKDFGRWSGVPDLKKSSFLATSRYSDAPQGEKAQLVRSTSQRDNQKGAFRTPGLRNIAKTPPYMHAGQFETLDAVLEFYNELPEPDASTDVGQRSDMLDPLDLSDDQLRDLKAFLESLSGCPLPARLKRQPNTPERTDQ